MSQALPADALTIRPANAEDAGGIARIFVESARFHARLDPDRYWVPAMEAITARYREHRPHLMDAHADSITLIAELGEAIVGFVDARLDRSPDIMHRNISYCHVDEIAIGEDHQNKGFGERLLLAAEDWGRLRGAQFASLDFHAANTRAGVFYQRRMGYRVAALTAIKPLG